jgi:hypothetical protein
LCTAAATGPSLHADYQSSTSVPVFAFSDGASIGGSSQRDTLYFFPYDAAGSVSVLERANVTGNSATEYGAAVLFDFCDSLRFQYCEIRSNAGSNCIFIGMVRTSAVIRCISVRSNTADGRDAAFRGLFHVRDQVNISESAIAGNTAPFLVDGDSYSAASSITFSECHFDSFSQTATVAGFFMLNCATDAAEFPGLPAVCLSRTRTRSATPSRTPPLSASPTSPLVPSLLLPRTAVLRFSSPILLSPPGSGSPSLAESGLISSAVLADPVSIRAFSFLSKSNRRSPSAAFSWRCSDGFRNSVPLRRSVGFPSSLLFAVFRTESPALSPSPAADPSRKAGSVGLIAGIGAAAAIAVIVALAALMRRNGRCGSRLRHRSDSSGRSENLPGGPLHESLVGGGA